MALSRVSSSYPAAAVGVSIWNCAAGVGQAGMQSRLRMGRHAGYTDMRGAESISASLCEGVAVSCSPWAQPAVPKASSSAGQTSLYAVAIRTRTLCMHPLHHPTFGIPLLPRTCLCLWAGTHARRWRAQSTTPRTGCAQAMGPQLHDTCKLPCPPGVRAARLQWLRRAAWGEHGSGRWGLGAARSLSTLQIVYPYSHRAHACARGASIEQGVTAVSLHQAILGVATPFPTLPWLATWFWSPSWRCRLAIGASLG